MARCFVTSPLPGNALDRLRAAHDVDVRSERTPAPREALLAGAHRAEGLLTLLHDRIDEPFLEQCPRLRAIANYGVGVDNVDLDAATRRGIPVGNTPGVLTDTSADFAFALLMAAARQVVEAAAAVRAGDWPGWEPGAFLGRDVHGAVLGIVGYGRIGQAVARRGAGFGMEIVHTGEVSLDELLGRADFVSLHTPLTDATRGLIGDHELALMKPTAILINTARGEVVDTAALERALRAGTIAGAALDVTDPEPLPADHPLLAAPNVLVTPHIASASHATREAMAEIAVDNLLAALRGERMPNCANADVYREDR